VHWAILTGLSIVRGKSRPRQPGWYGMVWWRLNGGLGGNVGGACEEFDDSDVRYWVNVSESSHQLSSIKRHSLVVVVVLVS